MANALKRLQTTLIEFLKQGVSPHELALAISLGMIIGMFPVQGITTFFCVLISIVFRLNLVVMQLANYLSIPLMMIMIVPFFVTGDRLFGSSDFQLSVQELLNLFNRDFLGALTTLSWSVLYAIFAWIIFAPAGISVVYIVSIRIIKRLKS